MCQDEPVHIWQLRLWTHIPPPPPPPPPPNLVYWWPVNPCEQGFARIPGYRTGLDGGRRDGGSLPAVRGCALLPLPTHPRAPALSPPTPSAASSPKPPSPQKDPLLRNHINASPNGPPTAPKTAP
ncbi:hypothetical protein PLESTB_001476100 [Pleodorina starrii]|uniref:Uncharacterized protein n=1 Tax=Pleodorina starrii TaxID=330485 RepID=A0A9W6F892_9CHLO|nr:hypothetical protein PLESTM_000647500 [Pleodorina starrii]GLC59341.1 hypothetical protein PLESTB_001476100 [Pleodorina starrii]GLC74460.1 hypothetical protein PLESTF_001515200 [Pleodorina starrii]